LKAYVSLAGDQTLSGDITFSGAIVLTGSLELTEGSAAAPAVQFGTGADGIYGSANNISFTTNGVQRAFMNSTWTLTNSNSAGGAIRNETASATNPTLIPWKVDHDTGIGNNGGLDQLSLIAGGLEGIRITESAAAITVDINGQLNVAADDTKLTLGASGELELYHTAVGNTVINHTPATGFLVFTEGGIGKLELNFTSNYVAIRDGWGLRIQDAADVDIFETTHNGTDVLADFNSAARFYRFNSLTDSVRIETGATLKIGETSAANPDNAGYGQIWVKNTTPCQLWYTDDAGTDTQIV